MKLTLDFSTPSPVALNPIWRFGANTCHAPLWLRDDLMGQVRTMRHELGFQYIRAHGLLCDRMNIVQPDGSFDFTLVAQAFDRLLATGLRPFLELSHLPSKLSRVDSFITAYQFYGGPPKNWKQWYELIKALVTFLRDRYGEAELRLWYFEVWNEPDLKFWSGTQQEYFKLYDLAARAVKEVCPAFRVGGPATSKTAWIDEFLAHVIKPSKDFGLDMPRCDFVATHAYPSDLAFVDSDRGDVKLQNSNIMFTLFRDVRRKVDAALGEGFPVICGEWNSSAGPLVANHDECNNSAFIAKTLVELSTVCQGSLYWNASDIYEECRFHYEPFHGGYGIMTVNDVRKSSYHAFAFLNEHRGQAVKVTASGTTPDGLGWLASRDDETARLLLYYYREPTPQGLKAKPVKVQLAGLGRGVRPAEVRSVTPGKGSAYETWLEMGQPPYLTAAILQTLTSASEPLRQSVDISKSALTIEPGTVVQVTWRA